MRVDLDLARMGRRRLGKMAAGAALATIVDSGRSRRAVAEPVEAARSPALREIVVDVDGLPMLTRVSADPPPGAPPLVPVHGLALSGRYMVPVVERLAARYHIMMPDLPGFGDSGKPDHVLDVPGLATWLERWMQAIGLERAMLLGNSFGCQVIVDLAARYPDRVERAVLQGPTTPPAERTWIQQFVRWRQNAPNSPPEMDAIAGSDYEKCGLVRALTTFEFSLRDAPEAKLSAIEAPVLVVRGAEDPICNQVWAEMVADGLVNGRLKVIPEVAHTLVFTAPRELAAVSEPFLDQTTLAA